MRQFAESHVIIFSPQLLCRGFLQNDPDHRYYHAGCNKVKCQTTTEELICSQYGRKIAEKFHYHVNTMLMIWCIRTLLPFRRGMPRSCVCPSAQDSHFRRRLHQNPFLCGVSGVYNLLLRCCQRNSRSSLHCSIRVVHRAYTGILEGNPIP